MHKYVITAKKDGETGQAAFFLQFLFLLNFALLGVWDFKFCCCSIKQASIYLIFVQNFENIQQSRWKWHKTLQPG